MRVGKMKDTSYSQIIMLITFQQIKLSTKGTRIAFLNADAPWDTPHPQTIDIVHRDTEEMVYSTGVSDYTRRH
jgi:hypothetical protein